MENIDFDWLNSNWASNLEFRTPDSPRAGTAAELASQFCLFKIPPYTSYTSYKLTPQSLKKVIYKN